MPPTDNQLHEYQKGKIVNTEVYRQWRKEINKVWDIWFKQNPDFIMFKPTAEFFLLWRVIIFQRDWNRDPQNHFKALRDGLTGNLYDDDKFVFVLPSETHKPQIDPANPRIILDPNPKRLI